ncbi:hypothetical protein [Streptomyces sp. NPDC002855]|uniref:hypothetical protein n=1 Tax=Streptomyces sp. NPDC002855 TaxID=3154437 RepID=UPI00331EB911
MLGSEFRAGGVLGTGEALVIGVGTFGCAAGGDEELPTGIPQWAPLPFVPEVASQVADAVRGLGYVVTMRMDPVRDELRGALDDGAGPRVVHVVSHGHQTDRGDVRLDVVPADGRFGESTSVSNWASTAQMQRRPTLFLLDLCGAGRVARLPQHLHEAGRETYAWVIAAADAAEDAYDGRFSVAVSQVLQELSRTGLGTDPSRRFVSFTLVARQIAMRLEGAEGRVQTVRATPVDPSAAEPKLPFFPNPLFIEALEQRQRAAVDAPVREFLDELDPLDARHFTDKAGRYFTGRRSQLQRLAPWLDEPAEAVTGSAVCVVTGSPGTGKSALVGALVCAAHQLLAEQAGHIRERLEPACRPAVHPNLAAVQARQRSVDDVVRALADQLRLVEPEGGWSPEAFVAAVGAAEEAPTVVVDALDEALDPRAVTDEILLPLTRLRRAGPADRAVPDQPSTERQYSKGTAGCRLMVGMRPWGEFAFLRRHAEYGGLLVDLDHSEPGELQSDLAAYLNDVLSGVDGYRSGLARRVRESLAEAAAEHLAFTERDGERWGEFLVASVFARYLTAEQPARTVDEARDLGSRVPSALPDILELDLSARPNAATARGLLVAIAHAKGEGMPTELAYALAGAFHHVSDTAEFADALDVSLFYLRTGIDTEGTTVYRPFHQGLADYLRAHPYRPMDSGRRIAPLGHRPAAELVLDTLLGRSHDPSARRVVWANASPYLLRHIIQHAQDADRDRELIGDPEFLVHADSSTLVTALMRYSGEKEGTGLVAVVYRSSLREHRSSSPLMRRQYLALDAARYGAGTLLSRLASGLPTGAWQPRWATSEGAHSVVPGVLTSHEDAVGAVACVVVDGRPVAVTGSADGIVMLWDLATGQPVGRPLLGPDGAVNAVACMVVDGRPVAVTGSADGSVMTWDLDIGQPVEGSPPDPVAAVNALSCVVIDGRPVAVVGSFDGRLSVLDLVTGELVGRSLVGHEGPVWAVACAVVDGRPVAATGSADGSVLVWDLAAGELVGRSLVGHEGPVWAVACVVVDGRPVAVTGSADGSVSVWDLAGGELVGRSLVGHEGPVWAVACAVVDGRPIAATGSDDDTVRVWDLLSGTCEVLKMPESAGAVAFSTEGDLVIGFGKGVVVMERKGGRRCES